MIKGWRVDKENKKYIQILPAVWKAEKREPEVNHKDAEKITIPAGSAKLVKVRTEGNWTGEGVVELLPLEGEKNFSSGKCI